MPNTEWIVSAGNRVYVPKFTGRRNTGTVTRVIGRVPMCEHLIVGVRVDECVLEELYQLNELNPIEAH